MSQIKKMIGAVLACAAVHTAQATTIQTINGFVPLQLTENLSIQDFYSGVGGWNQSYHLASNKEIQSLLDSYGIASHGYAAETKNEDDFIHQIGGLPWGTSPVYGPGAAVGFSYDTFVSVTAYQLENSSPVGSCPAYTDCSYVSVIHGAQSYTSKDSNKGLFLVEGAAVPEPASLALFGLGLGALVMRRRPR